MPRLSATRLLCKILCFLRGDSDVVWARPSQTLSQHWGRHRHRRKHSSSRVLLHFISSNVKMDSLLMFTRIINFTATQQGQHLTSQTGVLLCQRFKWIFLCLLLLSFAFQLQLWTVPLSKPLTVHRYTCSKRWGHLVVGNGNEMQY